MLQDWEAEKTKLMYLARGWTPSEALQIGLNKMMEMEMERTEALAESGKQ